MRTSGRSLRQSIAVWGLTGTVAIGVAACGSSHHNSSANAHQSGKTSTTAASSNTVYGAIPATGTPVKGGTLTLGFVSGSTPAYILPIVPGSLASVFTIDQFQDQMYLPLYNSPAGKVPKVDPAVGVAEPPTFSSDGKTVTIKLKPGYRWSNGQPVDAQDVIFDVDLLKAAAKLSADNLPAYTPGLFPDSVTSISAPSKDTVVMHLDKRFNPGFFVDDQLLGIAYPLPSTQWNIAKAGGPHLNYTVPANAAKIYTYLNKESMSLATWATNPLWKDSDGPFTLKSFDPTNSTFVMDANPKYGGSPKPSVAAYEGESYTGTTPELNALTSGSLDIALLDSSQLGQVSSLKSRGISVYGYPDLGWDGAFINFKDTTGHFDSIAKQLYFRQALAHLEDQPAYIKGIFKNAADPAYGPVPSAPVTPFTPTDAVKTVYPFSTSAAKGLLKSHGWKIVPNGTDTCQKAGSGAGECGAGIPQGTPLKFVWDYVDPSFQQYESLESESVASQAKTIGIDIELQSKTFNFMVQHLNDANPGAKPYTNTWGVNYFGGYTDDIYPTQNSIFNTGGSYNQGGYADPRANALIHASVYGANAKAVTAEASYLTANLPVLFFPNPDLVYAVSSKVGGTPDAFLDLTQYQPFAQYFWLKH